MKNGSERSLKVYPRLCADVRTIHINPGTSLVFRKRINDEANLTSFMSAALGDEIGELVNVTAAQLLAASDGCRTVKTIANSLCTIGDPTKFESESAAFFTAAVERNFVDLLDAPSPMSTPIHVTGSPEYFTPFHISVELTSKCNLRCSYCYTSFLEKEERLSTVELLRTLQEWKELGLQSLELTGGEALLHEDFWEIIDYCYTSFRSVSLLTNGTLITEEKAQRLASYKKKLVMSISLDGGTKEAHETTRGVNTFDRTVNAIRWLKRYGVGIRMSMTLSNRNSYDIERAAELARELEVDYFAFSPVVSYGRGEAANAEWTVEEAEGMSSLMDKVNREYADIIPRFPQFKLEKVEGMFGNCGLGHKNLVLTPSGKLKACLFLKEEDYLGDVRKERLIDIFRKPIIKKFRDIRNPSPERCGGCKYAWYCAGCTSRALLILNQEKRLCEWAHTYAISECFPRYSIYSYDPEQPLF